MYAEDGVIIDVSSVLCVKNLKKNSLKRRSTVPVAAAAAVATVGVVPVPGGKKDLKNVVLLGIHVDVAITGSKSVFINSDTCNIVGLVSD